MTAGPLLSGNTEPARPAAEVAQEHLAAGRPDAAAAVLESTLSKNVPSACEDWLLLGHIRESLGQQSSALQAYFQAVTRAQRAGLWRSQGTTPSHLLNAVVHAIERVRLGRRELFFGSYESLRQQHGNAALARVDRALSGYLKEWDATPPDPRQRPRFFYFPDLPSPPYHDPMLQPWAGSLLAAYPQIREEALRVLREDDAALEDFIQLKAGERADTYLSGNAPDPAWEALFFYRHGERFDDNHARCPRTSAALESIELCRIEEQAPEICFSVLKPGTTIKPHFGVTNVRLVMHLPLIVPPDCALNIVNGKAHAWREGELMMFDDTFEHEAWNRSNRARVILLMDCWNPHLTAVEKQAVKQLLETISGLHLAHRPRTSRSDRS